MKISFGKVLMIILLSMVPTFEGRYALTTGIAAGMPAALTFIIAYVFSTVPVFLIFPLLKPILDWLYNLPLKPKGAFWKKHAFLYRTYKKVVSLLKRFAAWVHNRSMKKAKGMDKKGILGLFVFVALPVPGTGVWTGSAIATLLEMNKKHAIPAILLGNLCACLIMLLATLGVISIFG